VRDWRVGQIQRMANVTVYRASALTAAEIREFGFAHAVIATGAAWRKDGVGRAHVRAISGSDAANVFTPEDVFAGTDIPSPVLVFDDDHYYMGGVIAEALRARGLEVTLVTPAGDVSAWTEASLEQPFIQAQLINSGIAVITGHSLTRVGTDAMELACAYTGKSRTRAAKAVVMVTSRLPDDTLYRELVADPAALAAAGIQSVSAIGDCRNPGTIAAAVHAGHRYARELDEPPPGDVPFRVEHVRHV
jgi:dimethylamine/trimethylamine dehydrogenase